VLASPLQAQAPRTCADGIGVARTIAIDTTGGPWFGGEHGDPGLLRPGEVVLTFDDGPAPDSTRPILWALAAECTKATFFVVGQMAAAHPEVVREIAIQGHTIGTHTWSHANLRQVPDPTMRAQIESAFTAVEKAADRPIAPFFRHPYLSSSRASVAYLQGRHIAQFSVDIDSLDWRLHSAEGLVRVVMARLEERGKGIVLLHDIHPSTARAIPKLLGRLKEKGYKIVHLRSAAPATTLVAYRTPPKAPRLAQRPRRDAEAKPQEGGWLWKWFVW
jgi:peptidoglycan/xylan/chitin deacetylase (PgdA/CDA1 family)